MALTAGGSLVGLADSSVRDGQGEYDAGELRAPPPRDSMVVHSEDSLSEMLSAAPGLRNRTVALQRAGVARRPSSHSQLLRSRASAQSPPMWAPAGKVASLGPSRRRRPVPRADPRKAARIQKRHEWYMRQAALPGKVDRAAKQLGEARLRTRAADCLVRTDVQRRVSRSLRLYEEQRAAKALTLHEDWTREVYEPITHRLRAAVDEARGRPELRQTAYEDFLRYSATASRLYLDDAGERKGDYDPMQLNRNALRVWATPIARDPLKRSLVKAGAEVHLMLRGGGDAEAGRLIRAGATRTAMHEASSWTIHREHPRRLVPGMSHAPSRVEQDHFAPSRGNSIAAADFPVPAKGFAPVPSRNVVEHVVEPVFGPEDNDVHVDIGELPEAAVRRCT